MMMRITAFFFRINKLAKALPVVSLILGTASGALASDFHSPRTAALGGAGHAGPLLNDSIILNPSYTSFLPTYSLAGTYSSGEGYNFSVQDGRTQLFQAGVSYTQRDALRMIQVGASRSIVKRLGFGVGGKFYINRATNTMFHDAVFSTSGVISNWFQAAFIVDNLIQSEAGRAFGMYREFTLGTKFNIDRMLLLYFDPHLIPDSPNGSEYGYEAGVEFVTFSDVFLRGGAFRNSRVPSQYAYGNGYGLGLGWVAPRLSLDYGVSRIIRPVHDTIHHVGMTIFF